MVVLSKSKKIITIIVGVLVVCIVGSVGVYEVYREKTIYPDFLKEYENEVNLDYAKRHCFVSGNKDYCYFFVQSEKHYCFNGNGVEELKRYLPDFDLLTLDLKKYNYIVAVNCKVKAIKYSRKTAYKTMTFGIDAYKSDATLEKTYDNKVRIYRMKSLNIDLPGYDMIGVKFDDED